MASRLRNPMLVLAGVCVIAAVAGCNLGTLDFSASPTSPTSPTPIATGTVGDGHSGDKTINTATIVNVCAPITLGTAHTVTMPSTGGFAAGDMILLLQPTNDTGPVPPFGGTS